MAVVWWPETGLQFLQVLASSTLVVCAQIVYEFLLRYVVSNDTDAKAAKKHIDQYFVVRLTISLDVLPAASGGSRARRAPGGAEQ